MEERKQREIEYYDKGAEDAKGEIKEAGSLGGFNPFDLASYKQLKVFYLEKSEGKKVLDFGCGTGIHLPFLSETASEVVGIDLSSKSVEAAGKLAEAKNIFGKAKVVLGDCEETGMASDSFDIVFDGGTFSSLDLEKAIKEISRLLKPGGCVIGIETLGHNPATNLKRKMNRILGLRTGWAADHIFRVEDLDKVKIYFENIEVKYFHLISWLAFPFLGFPGGKLFLEVLETTDSILISILPFLKKYSFKIVFVFSNPKKSI